MSLRVRILPEAEADLVEAFVWYDETQRGLGGRFLAAVRDALDFAAEKSGCQPTSAQRIAAGIFAVAALGAIF